MDGFEAPIHKSLTQVIMLGGVPREIAILNGTMTAAIVLGLHSLFGLPVGIVVHFLCVHLAKDDPQFFYIYRRCLRYRAYYEA